MLNTPFLQKLLHLPTLSAAPSARNANRTRKSPHWTFGQLMKAEPQRTMRRKRNRGHGMVTVLVSACQYNALAVAWTGESIDGEPRLRSHHRHSSERRKLCSGSSKAPLRKYLGASRRKSLTRRTPSTGGQTYGCLIGPGDPAQGHSRDAAIRCANQVQPSTS